MSQPSILADEQLLDLEGPASAESPLGSSSAGLVRQLIADLGEDTSREGLLATPERVARSLRFLTSGYRTSVAEVVNGALFEAPGPDPIVVRDIGFYSLCEHHLLPFFGKADIAYLPGERVLGLSKFARVVDVYARRLQLQERLTAQVADALLEVLEPSGVAVSVSASHLCMMMRGVERQGSITITRAIRGVSKEDAAHEAMLRSLLT